MSNGQETDKRSKMTKNWGPYSSGQILSQISSHHMIILQRLSSYTTYHTHFYKLYARDGNYGNLTTPMPPKCSKHSKVSRAGGGGLQLAIPTLKDN